MSLMVCDLEEVRMMYEVYRMEVGHKNWMAVMEEVLQTFQYNIDSIQAL